MTTGAINDLGTATLDMDFTDEGGLELFGVDADVGYTTTAAAESGLGATDSAVYTEDGIKGAISTSKDISWYVVNAVQCTPNFRTPNGVQMSDVLHNGVGAVCGIFASSAGSFGAFVTNDAGADVVFNRCLGITGAQHGFYARAGAAEPRNCIMMRSDTSSAASSFVLCDSFHCTNWQIGVGHSSANGFWFGTVQDCISVQPLGDCYDTASAVGDGYNLSSDTTAPGTLLGTSKWHSIAAVDIFLETDPGLEDPAWLSQAAADSFPGIANANVTRDFALVERGAITHLGAYTVTSGGGNGGGALAARQNDDAYYYGLV